MRPDCAVTSDSRFQRDKIEATLEPTLRLERDEFPDAFMNIPPIVAVQLLSQRIAVDGSGRFENTKIQREERRCLDIKRLLPHAQYDAAFD